MVDYYINYLLLFLHFQIYKKILNIQQTKKKFSWFL